MSTRRLDYEVAFEAKDITLTKAGIGAFSRHLTHNLWEWFDENFEGEVVRQALYKYVMDYGVPADTTSEFKTKMYFRITQDEDDEDMVEAVDEETWNENYGWQAFQGEPVENPLQYWYGYVNVIVAQVEYTTW